MAPYYLSIGFDSTDNQSDALHYDADYGFASSTGNAGTTSLGNSGPAGRTFEVVHLSASGQGQPNQLMIALFTSIYNIDQTNSYFRVSFRPAHDVTPSSNVAVSPLIPANSNALLAGVAIGSRQSQTADVNGTNWGLPAGDNVTQFLYGPYQLAPGPASVRSQSFEVTVEISILIGTQWT